jgi:pilus assembly protein Flp/PilA
MVAMYSHITALLSVLGKRFGDKTKGATAVEYGIMVAAIAAVIIAVVILIGTELDGVFNNVLADLQGI